MKVLFYDPRTQRNLEGLSFSHTVCKPEVLLLMHIWVFNKATCMHVILWVVNLAEAIINDDSIKDPILCWTLCDFGLKMSYFNI